MTATRVRPDALADADAVRKLGVGVTGLLSVLSGAMLTALIGILLLAVDPAGRPAFGPVLLVSALLGGYLAAAPSVFARRTRAHTATGASRLLLTALGGYVVLWAAVLATL